MRVCVLIPIYNEARAIGRVVEEILKKGLDVVVVDDGSTDGSGAIAQKQGATVLRTPGRSGKGGALKTGFEYLLNKNYEVVLLMDGDGQHAAADIDTFLERYRATKDAMIVGNRMKNNRNMPVVRRMTNSFMSWMISLLCRQPVPDTQCGFRLVTVEALRNFALTVSGFEIETELLVQASRKGYRISSVPVQTIYEDEDSKINPLADTVKFFRYIFRELFKRNAG